ncbi:secretin N-terminal domain-containing protein [Gemmata sp. JC717]|uniref:secretin N-terminal domain-containing protein n=1 Tax=Gemmata algarum TaxID=2975278 RepID=UPI0021BAFE8B|nr:secretin N-terminal domain-containing protein [Gemmata algarum]MDY3556068.1 secretin N-terminal domain-containing protein [Gemmata algarum]
MAPRHGNRLRAVPVWKLLKLRKWLPGVLAAAAGLAGPVDMVLAQPMPAPGKPGVVAPTAPAAAPEKQVSIHFEKAGWDEVLDWYAKETGLTLITTVKPTGTVAIKPGKDRKFTVGEVTDLINEAMMQQKFLLIRRHMTFFIQPSDEKIDPTLLPRIALDELPKRGRTEIVQIVLPVKGMVVTDSIDELKKLLTPFGTMIPLTQPNAFLVQDTVGNIARIQSTLDEIEKKDGLSDSLSHVCEYRRPQELAEVLAKLMTNADVKVDITGAQNAAGWGGGPGGWGGGPGGWGGGPGGWGGDRGGGDRGRGPTPPTAPAATGGGRVKTVQIAVDARRNAIYVTAPQDKIGLAKKLIEEQDKPLTPTQVKLKVEEPVLKTYTVPAGSAAELAKAIQAKLPWVQTIALPAQNQIMVLAAPIDQIDIAKIISGGDGGTGGSEAADTTFIPLNVLEPGEAAATLVKFFPTPAAGGPTIEPQKTGPTPGLLFMGTPAQLATAKKILGQQGETGLGAPGTALPGNNATTRTINLGGSANAAAVAEMFSRVMEGRGKRVIIQDPLNPPSRTNPAPAPGTSPLRPKADPPKLPDPVKPPPLGAREPLPGRDFLIAAQVVDPAKREDKPIIITVAGNRLVIESEDTAALDVLSQLARYIVTEGAKPDENLFRVIRLKYVAAEDAARELTEIFNGPQQQQQRGGGGGPGGGRGGFGGLNPLALLGLGGGGDTGPASKDRIRVVAEKSSNSVVVVKASPVDLVLIEKLLGGTIDAGVNDSAAVLKTFILPLKNADAAEMAAVVRDVYRSAMGTSGRNAAVGAMPAFNPFAAALQGGGGQPQQQQPPALSISVDDRSNSIILLCAETLYADVRELVTELDNATVATTEVVKLVQLKGVDPNVVQQAVNAMRGIDSRQQGGRGGFGGGGGTGGFGGGGTGGGFPGGGGFGGGTGGFGGGGFGGGTGGFGGGGTGGFGGGGNRGGGGGAGGGGNRGGGGGGGGARGGRTASLNNGGPTANFDYRGTDAPSAVSTIYDPQTDEADFGYNRPAPPRPLGAIVMAGGQQPAGPGAPPMMTPPVPPGSGDGVYTGPAPRGVVTAIPIQGLDALVLRTADAKDLQIVLELIEILQRTARNTQPRVEIVPLENGDCNTVADQFNALFSRVQFGQNGGYLPGPRVGSTNVGNVGFGQNTGAASAGAVAALALPRLNAVLLVAPEARFEDAKNEMKRLFDQSSRAPFKAFHLKRASAQLLAYQLQNFWNTRYPGDPQTKNQFRVTFDTNSNTVFVQGSAGDLKDVEELITLMDISTSKAVNDMRIFKLKNALSDELGQVLSQALTSNVLNPLAQQQFTGPQAQLQGGAAAFGITANQGGGANQFGQGNQFNLGTQGAVPGAIGQTTGQFGATQVQQINALIPTIGTGSAGGLHTKTTAIKFYSARDGKTYETGFLEDIHIVSHARINSLIIAAPTETMKLIETLIENLDTVAAARSYVNVFRLSQGADATLTANLIAQLFTGQGRTATTGIQNQGLGQNTTQARPLLTISPEPSAGASLIDLRLSVDDRTNSIIVAGSLNDLDTIRAIIARLEGSQVQNRYHEVVKLRNAAAADVANSVQQFFTQALQVYTGAQFTSVFQQLQRSVVVIAEPVSNTVLVSATPEYFGEIKRIIDKIDAQPPQVVIQVTIAEVQLNNTEELGVEVGLQSPVLFDRGTTLNFNTTTALPAGNNVGNGIVGFQGLGNLGVGRSSPTQGVGGFVFSASNDTFSLLVRALKAQGRVDVLSRPQIQVADSQTGYVNIGQSYPVPTATTITNGLAQQGITYQDIGISLRVTPRVSPDGKVLMRVEPTVSSVQPNTVAVGGIQAAVFNSQTVQTTVLASDGETIVLGGLLSKTETKSEVGIPYAKDIPYLGALFRYRQHQVQKREILVIMTPHIVRSEYDNARILAEESAKLKWCLPEVLATHKHGGEVMGPAAAGARPVPTGAGGPQGQPNFVPGPAYFGTFNAPIPLDGGPATGGMLQPGTPQPQPGTVVPPGAMPQNTVMPPNGGAAILPVQPAPMLTPAPGTMPAPGVSAPPLPGTPGAALPSSSGVMPVSASQPVFAPPSFPQPGFAPAVPAVAPQIPAAPQGAGYVMQQPGQPVPAAPAPAVPGAPNRGFAMSAPPAAAPTQSEPGRGKDASPVEQKPYLNATEGTKSWVHDIRR